MELQLIPHVYLELCHYLKLSLSHFVFMRLNYFVLHLAGALCTCLKFCNSVSWLFLIILILQNWCTIRVDGDWLLGMMVMLTVFVLTRIDGRWSAFVACLSFVGAHIV